MQQCNNFVMTSHDTLASFLTFQNFCHDMAHTTPPDRHRHAYC